MIDQVAAVCISIVLNEGVKAHTYEDHIGFLTAGVGHRLTPDDPEFHLPVGTWVTNERIAEWFIADCSRAERGAKAAVPNFDELPTGVQHILTEMSFQLGDAGLRGFKNMIAALAQKDYETAALEMRDSKWRTQTPDRCDKLSYLMSSYSIPW
jgi:lysozyme